MFYIKLALISISSKISLTFFSCKFTMSYCHVVSLFQTLTLTEIINVLMSYDSSKLTLNTQCPQQKASLHMKVFYGGLLAIRS